MQRGKSGRDFTDDLLVYKHFLIVVQLWFCLFVCFLCRFFVCLVLHSLLKSIVTVPEVS